MDIKSGGRNINHQEPDGKEQQIEMNSIIEIRIENNSWADFTKFGEFQFSWIVL